MDEILIINRPHSHNERRKSGLDCSVDLLFSFICTSYAFLTRMFPSINDMCQTELLSIPKNQKRYTQSNICSEQQTACRC